MIACPMIAKISIIPRRASFIGSTNQAEFLNDESGSVRWLCFAMESIDWSYKEKNQHRRCLGASLQFISHRLLCDLTPDEIKENEEYNRQFHITTSEFELINKYLKPGTKEDQRMFYDSDRGSFMLAEKHRRESKA